MMHSKKRIIKRVVIACLILVVSGVWLENCQTVIGTITCSGFNHEQDHSIIIDVCRKLKRENVL